MCLAGVPRYFKASGSIPCSPIDSRRTGFHSLLSLKFNQLHCVIHIVFDFRDLHCCDMRISKDSDKGAACSLAILEVQRLPMGECYKA